MKRRMTEQQEFDIMKLVFDKFLWAGFAVMLFGVYKMLTATISDGLYFVIIGAVILIALMVIIVREYEIIK